ncbi:MAG TPA: arsenate reductase ArsC [Gemmatimonadales bacterium]|nr:arsenate reductase ArsC [Gemmatimonadales bacterium]
MTSATRTVVFLCVGNSARSQMAEGLARATAPPGWTVYSAGSDPGKLSSHAVQVMAEVGMDIAHHRSKGLKDVPFQDADAVITLCAEEVCPVAPGVRRRLHWPLPDPTAVAADGQERLQAFRRVRDELRKRIAEFWKDAG